MTIPGLDPTQDGPLHRQAAQLRARLEDAFPPRLFVHDHVEAKLTPTTWGRLTRRLPFIGLGFVSIDPARDSGRMLQADTLWEVMLVCANPRPAERVLGDAQGPGLFGMIQVAIWALHGFTIGGDTPRDAAGTVRVTKVDHSYVAGLGDDQTALAQVQLAVPGMWRADLPLEDFLRTRTVWDFPVPAAATDDLNVRTAP